MVMESERAAEAMYSFKEVVLMLASVSRRGLVAPLTASEGVWGVALSLEDGFHISHIARDSEVDDQTRPLLPRDRLPVLESGCGSRSSRGSRVGGESSGTDLSKRFDGPRVPRMVAG